MYKANAFLVQLTIDKLTTKFNSLKNEFIITSNGTLII